MYKDVYELIQEILRDESLNNYIVGETGKNLAIMEAGAKMTSPSASIYFSGGNFSRRSNSSTEITYTVLFMLPYWRTDGFVKCLEFVDFVLPIFFDYKTRTSFVMSVNPSINEMEGEGSQDWAVEFQLTVSSYIL